MSDTVPVFAGPTPEIRKIGMDRPWIWLAKGWEDLRKAPAISLAYGLIFAAAGLVLGIGIWAADLFFYLILPLAAGFMLMGPLLAVGLYETSRRIERAEPLSLSATLTAFKRNASQIALMGLVLMLFLLAWIRIATLIFALFYNQTPPTLDTLLETLFLSPQSLSFLITGVIVGGILAVLVFSISVVSIPMLLDRNTNVFTAIATSFATVRENPAPMLTWGALVVLFTAAGLVTAFAGLIVTLPLIGHATWHAYKDLVLLPEA